MSTATQLDQSFSGLDYDNVSRRFITVRLDQLISSPVSQVRAVNDDHIAVLIKSFRKFGFDSTFGDISVYSNSDLCKHVFERGPEFEIAREALL